MSKRALAAGIATSIAALAVAFLPAVAQGAPQQEFVASAVAAGMRTTYKTVNDPTGTVFDGSAPLSTAAVSTAPDSTAFAAAPYPGDDLIALANAVLPGAGIPPQAYPLAVRSGVPGEPKASKSAPGYSLLAESTVTSSHSSASVGPTSSGDVLAGSSSGLSEVKADGSGAVSATGRSATNSFAAGPLSLSKVTSRATAVLGVDGKLTLSTAMEVGDITVAGQRVGLTRQGLTVAGTKIPLPIGELTDALKASGIIVTYLAEERTDHSVTAPGLLITYKDGQQDARYTLGRAQAGVDTSAGTPQGPLIAQPVPVDQPPAAGGGSIPGSTGSGVPVAVGTAPGVAAPQPAVQPGAEVTQPVAVSARNVASRPLTFSSGLFYLVLVLAAVATLAAGQFMRYLGVRWESS